MDLSTGPIDIFSFAPDPARAAALDARVRGELADSLETVFTVIAETGVAVDGAAAQSLAGAARAHPVGPGLFGLYTDLVEAASADDIERSRRLIEGLFERAHWRGPPFKVVAIDDRELGPGQAERYRRLLDDDVRRPLRLRPVSAEIREQGEALLADTMTLLDGASPSLAGEIRALVREVVLVGDAAGSGGTGFTSGSTFYLWGALFLNAAALADRLAAALSLTHEAAHLHLFGVTLGARLVENPDGEFFPSPLREDPRPMDGLVHAAYVLARMTYCLRALIAAGVLSHQEADRARGLLERYCENYRTAQRTILDNARFTPEGASVFGGARDYMAAEKGTC